MMKPQAKAIVGVCVAGVVSACFASVIIGTIESRHARDDQATQDANCRLKSDKTPGDKALNGCQTLSP